MTPARSYRGSYLIGFVIIAVVALRGLIGFALAADGTTRLKLYARTGHLAPAAEVDRAA